MCWTQDIIVYPQWLVAEPLTGLMLMTSPSAALKLRQLHKHTRYTHRRSVN